MTYYVVFFVMRNGRVLSYDHLDPREDIWEERNKAAVNEIAALCIEEHGIDTTQILSVGLHKVKRHLIERIYA